MFVSMFPRKKPAVPGKLEQLYNKYNSALYHYACYIIKDQQLAEDILQEAFIRINNNIAKIHEIDSKETRNFLITVVKNEAIRLLNKQSSDIINIEDYELDDTAYQKYWADKEIEYNKQELLEALRNLTPEEQKVIILTQSYGYTYHETGEILGFSEKNISVKLFRAKRRIAEILKKQGQEQYAK